MRRLAVGLAVLVTAALVAAPALADGDPASDVLFVQQVFLPYSANANDPDVQDLAATVANANQAGVGVRVAVIATRTDLGAVPGLFGKPKRYARFLGGEITFGWKKLVLIVMPVGLGISRSFHPAPREQAIVSQVKPESDDVPALARAGTEAVQRLAKAQGKTLPPLPERSSGGNDTRDRIVIGVAAAAGALLVAAIVLFGRRRRRADPPPG